ncbi:amino acid adenylation domain-containing protein [Corynebacterium terpenotabidum]|uniref:Non-ribosomal peptide synthetase component n=1 Tax=Corynebacterium terpenotabidum Y-11 TaxID=1200352 RepID=S4XGD0_9CORY|nr:amino acid adenylation domain-containing protein [Corynebacterium terpenotabidum]AGP31596.1 non-ribosomal peptide synthetase component [Corynebacterium terpenotabidum Y-11]
MTVPTYIGRPDDLRFGAAAPVDPATLDALFAATAVAHADAPAVVGDGGPLTFAELDRRASAIARYLRARGVVTGDRVAVVANRCGWMSAVVTGIIRSGAVYVPVDASYPKERVRFIIADCDPAAVFTLGGASLAKDLAAELEGSGVVTATITDDSPLGRAVIDGSADPTWATAGPFGPAEQSRPVTGEDPCYIIYTSGTTGTPKGAVNTHIGVTTHMLWMGRALTTVGDTTTPIRMLQKAPVSFDVGVGELIGPLATGGAVVVPAPDWWPGDIDAMVKMIAGYDVTVMSMVPSLMRVLFDVLDDVGVPLSAFSNIRHMIFGGEAVPADIVRRSREEIGCRVYGLYGPTETAMDVTWVEYTDELISAADFDDAASLLGLPEDNVACYVIAEDGTETDPASDTWDTPGELCLAGPQVGLGYLNRDAQTAEAFVDSLHPDLDGGRMYRTGDIVAWTEVGGQRILQFLGRIGDQVKIRGNRVELGEVETRLRELSGVRQAAAVAIDEDGAQALVGFLVAEDGVTPDLTALATQLATEVPEYMVPSRFRVVDTLPMNHNGKLDRKALATLL